MIILNSKAGQLCNRLFLQSTFITNAIEHNYKLRIIGFDKYYKYFGNINHRLRKHNIRFIFQDSFCSKIETLFHIFLIKIANRLNIINFFYNKTGNINDEAFIELARTKRRYITNWLYWDVQSFINRSEILREVFRPHKKTIDTAEEFIRKARGDKKKIVGVHVRRGDYKEYLEGKFFYSLDVYERIISEMQKELSSEKTTFIICSNEEISLQVDNINIIYSKFDAITDLVLLSKVDYIIGPPSTFSMWASFYGKVPLSYIWSEKTEIKIGDFSEIIAPNTFKNGKNFK